MVKPVVEEPTTRPKHKRPNSAIPLATAPKKKTSRKVPTAASSAKTSPVKTGPARKPINRVAAVIQKETRQAISEPNPAVTAQPEAEKSLAAAGD